MMSLMASRSRKAWKKGVKAPMSIAIAPHHSSCDAIRVSSAIMVRITLARSGTSICMPFSTHKAQAWLLICAER